MPGATVVVDPAPEGQEGEVSLRIVKPKKQKTPVGVGAGGGGDPEVGAEEPVGEHEHHDGGESPAES
jgi:ATP-dependent Clp protease ATP-binding subunit ClpC